MNILILSSGTRNKIVQYFKNEVGQEGKVIATDCSELAPSIYEADKHYIVPRITEPNYLETIFDICQKEQVHGIISLIDPELSLIANHIDKFTELGVTPILSDYELTERCFDKIEFMKMLASKGYNVIRSYNQIDDFIQDYNNRNIEFPVFVKPIKGSASININKVENVTELKVLFDLYDDLMIQEYMVGPEYGIDAYVDLIDNQVKSIFIKEKILMRAGETDKSRSVIDENFTGFIKQFLLDFGFKGVVDIDVFIKDDEYYISEVNPRFGGGYPHGYEVGVNIPKQIVNNLYGKTNKAELDNYEEDTYMMKYNEVKIIDVGDTDEH